MKKCKCGLPARSIYKLVKIVDEKNEIDSFVTTGINSREEKETFNLCTKCYTTNDSSLENKKELKFFDCFALNDYVVKNNLIVM